MKELPKINQLRNFQAIIRYGSIRTASQALFQTQPAMTRSIQELERILGVTLLARGPQGMVLTKMGRIFEPRVAMLLNDLERAVDELHQASQISQGSVVFGCSHLPAFSIMPALINKFQKEHPNATITIIEGQLSELITSLRLGRIDFYLGIASPEIAMNEFFIENAIKAEFCIMARHGHPLAGSTTLIQLQGCKWYFPNSRTGYYKELEKHIFPNGKPADSRIIYGDSMTIGEQLVTNEDYLFIGPKAILNVDHIKDIVSIVPIKETLPDAEYTLIYKQQLGLTPLAKTLMDEINAACTAYLARGV
ncbi:LysR substrate-binding domain-containing protein [Symbiopectobacterium purcellii]|uniref:LysR family transcriptional regulator n=1 Tax=Symbiopectobacterium purcellii TaxID=2871826 RepID=A0ABX9AGQ5_9ENTR|nr:LysR substrate-binding domain-containing protein [Symbiopectobacterium purcellii]QZN94337.1 LysR family transcriptional regulator [Symbiopectobacterium purcellii]